MQRLCGNLQVDVSKARQLLGWVPPMSSDEGLRRAMGAMGQFKIFLNDHLNGHYLIIWRCNHDLEHAHGRCIG